MCQIGSCYSFRKTESQFFPSPEYTGSIRNYELSVPEYMSQFMILLCKHNHFRISRSHEMNSRLLHKGDTCLNGITHTQSRYGNPHNFMNGIQLFFVHKSFYINIQ